MNKKNIKESLIYLLPVGIYGIIYILWFSYVERTVVNNFTVIEMSIDRKIPFIEYFIVPYFLWFPYVALAVVLFCFYHKKDYIRLCSFLFIGMTTFLIVSTLFPNGQTLRPETFERTNIFTNMVASLYKTDTPTNIVPSIHVYNSLAVQIAVMKCERLKKIKWLQIGSFILCTSIVLATMFLKQHSAFDAITAFLLAAITYPFVYIIDYKLLYQNYLERKLKRKESME